MGQIENVQRGILFTFFIYSVILVAAIIIKMVKNWIDKEAHVSDDEEGAKYAQKPEVKKAEESSNELDASKKGTNEEKKKQAPVVASSSKELTLDQIVLSIIKPVVLQEEQTILTKLLGRFRHHIFYHLPFFFPIALNVVTGTSYAFIFVLFFFLQASFGLFNDLKIHEACGAQNKIIKCIVLHLGFVLSFFAWVNLWGAATSPMPFFIQKGVII